MTQAMTNTTIEFSVRVTGTPAVVRYLVRKLIDPKWSGSLTNAHFAVTTADDGNWNLWLSEPCRAYLATIDPTVEEFIDVPVAD